MIHNEENELYQYNAGHVIKPVEIVLNAKELAAFLHVSLAHAYNLLNAADFPTLHIGKRKFVTMENLRKWMEKQTTPLHNA